MVERYKRAGYISTSEMEEAMLRVPREEFMDHRYRDYSYHDQPFPIPGDGRQTISAPYMYPATNEPLKIRPGHRVLEIGAGSGYGAAIIRELVGDEGLVVAIEINEVTHRFAVENLRRAGYDDVLVILGDGTLGHPPKAPYDAVSITAASPDIPPPILDQLNAPGRIVAPVGASSIYGQDLVLLEKRVDGEITRRVLMKVAYVPLLGEHGWRRR